MTGFAALGLYRQGRPEAAWQYVEALGELAFVESRGYTAELFSGDRLKSVDAAVPHQLFATSGFVSGLLRGTIGFDAAAPRPPGRPLAADTLHLRPALPPTWDRVTVRRLSWRGHRIDLTIEREASSVRIAVDVRPGPLPLVVDLPLPAGAEPQAVSLEGTIAGHAEVRRAIRRPGVAVAPVSSPLVAGARSGRLRVIEVTPVAGGVVARIAGEAGRAYEIDVWPATAARAIVATNARVTPVVASMPWKGAGRVRVELEASASGWTEARLQMPRP